MFVDGWILEMVDPYKEDYSIPSTRCTRVVAVDYAGSIPVTMNSMINAALPRSILGVENYLKGASSLPLTRLPAAGLVLTEPKSAEVAVPTPGVVAVTRGGSSSWRLRRRDEHRVLIASTFDPAGRVYNNTLLVTMPSQIVGAPKPDEHIPRASKFAPVPAGTSDVRQRSRVESLPSPPPPDGPEVPSSPVRSRRSDKGRQSTSAFTLKGELRHSTDLVVAEIIVDSKMYPEGYNVQITSVAREGSKIIALPSVPMSGTVDDKEGERRIPAAQMLPIASSVYTVPASPLHSSGLNADRPPRHLLRLTLPTAQYQVSTVEDPLTGETRGGPPKPRWLLDLQSKGFIIRVEIRPSGGGKKAGDGMIVVVDGTNMVVTGEKESLTMLGRDELQDDRVSRMAVLQRCVETSRAWSLWWRC